MGIKAAIQNLRKSRRNGLSPARQFSRLIRCLNQDDTKVVVSLGGGGIRLFAHLSVLRFLERLGVQERIAEIWGASGGAIIGLAYSMGASPDQIEEISKDIFDSKKLKIVPSYFSVAKNIMYETLFSRDNEDNLRGFHNCQELLQEVVSKVMQKGETKYPFYCLAYNLNTSQTDVLTPLKIPEGLYSGWIYQVNPLDAIVASSAIPILFVPKVIEDKKGRRVYVDGATNEEIPLVSIYKKWNRDKEFGLEKKKHLLVIAVNLHPDFGSLSFLKNWFFKRIPAFQYVQMTVQYADLMRRAHIEEQKRALLSDPNVELWELNLNLSRGGLLDVGLIPTIIRTAEKTFPKQFESINNSLLG